MSDEDRVSMVPRPRPRLVENSKSGHNCTSQHLYKPTNSRTVYVLNSSVTVILLAYNNTRPHVHWKTNTLKVLQLTVKLRFTNVITYSL